MNQPITKGIAKKTPVVMQLEALECGAACLTMILSYYGKWIPLEQVRVDCGVSRDGSSAKNMIQAAKNYGLETAAYKLEPAELREEGTFPCIIHWNFNHFVVLKGFKGNYAYINDPGRGEVKISMNAFDEAFTGVCMMFEPTDAFVPSGKKKTSLDYVRERLSGLGPIVAFGVLTTVIASLLSMISPGFTRVFYDRLLSGRDPDWADAFLLFFAGFSAFQIFISWLRTTSTMKIDGKMAVVGASNFMWKVLHLPLDFFQQRLIGDVLARKNSSASIASSIANTFAPLVINVGMMVFYLIVMIRYSLPLTIVSLLSLLISSAFSFYMSSKRVNSTRLQMRDSGKLSATTMAGIQSIETIKASGAEEGFFAKWAGYQASVHNSGVQYQKTTAYIGLVPQIITTICNIITLAIGVYLTMNRQFTLGMITAFQGYLNGFISPAEMLVSAGQTLQEMKAEMERVDDVMRYPEDFVYDKSNKVETENYQKLSGNVELKNVTFGYSPLAAPLIKDFNLSLKQGSRVALVGASGCGKSTIAKLICGLAKPWSGEILFDGKRLAEIDRDVFTGSVAVVDQDIILFEDTVRNNIKMWDHSIEDFEMILGARDAAMHEEIMHRENGYDHMLTEGGKNFSGGQRQRLEIARVLAQDPTICILDEATSALDAKTEYEVIKYIKDRGITCIVVAHRLSTIRDCDEIVVLSKGEVAERGTHEELMKRRGAYYELITSDEEGV